MRINRLIRVPSEETFPCLYYSVVFNYWDSGAPRLCTAWKRGGEWLGAHIKVAWMLVRKLKVNPSIIPVTIIWDSSFRDAQAAFSVQTR